MDEMLSQYDKIGKIKETRNLFWDSWQDSVLACEDCSEYRLKRFGINLLRCLVVLCLIWFGESVAGYIAAPLLEQSGLPLMVKVIFAAKEVSRIGRSVVCDLLQI